jgi:hypothetical protein
MIDVVALAAASDPRPDDNNVVAGWVGFVVFLALIVAVVFILRSFTKQMRKVREADEAGVFDDPADASDQRTDNGSPHHQA